MVYQHDPRHDDVLVKDLGLEHGKSVRIPAVHDVTDEEPTPLDHMQSSQLQFASCKMFVLLSRSCIHNIHCERGVPADVKLDASE